MHTKTERASWFHRIKAARERGHFTKADADDASSWMKCAVGEQMGARASTWGPSYAHGRGDAHRFYSAGLRFSRLVEYTSPGNVRVGNADHVYLDIPATKEGRISEAEKLRREIKKLAKALGYTG